VGVAWLNESCVLTAVTSLESSY